MGRIPAGRPRDSRILHEQSVDAEAVKKLQIRGKRAPFRIRHENIERHIYAHAENMAGPHGPGHFLFREISRIFPGAERLSAHVDRIRPGFQCGIELFRRTGRR